MTYDEIITHYFNSDKLNAILNKICSSHKGSTLLDDLKQYVFLIILEKPKSKIIEMHNRNELIYYIIMIFKNQFQSNTSPFYKKYRQHYSELNLNSPDSSKNVLGDNKEELKNDRLVRLLRANLNELNWYEQTLIKMRFKLDEFNRYDGIYRDKHCDKPVTSYRRIEELTTIQGLSGIDHVSAYLTVKKVIDKLKNRLKNNI